MRRRVKEVVIVINAKLDESPQSDISIVVTIYVSLVSSSNNSVYIVVSACHYIVYHIIAYHIIALGKLFK